jgi:hypothetical protein
VVGDTKALGYLLQMINSQKSSFYQFGVQPAVLDSIKTFFPYEVNHIANGFKYLGYTLKADRFKAEDWDWLLSKYENRINHWCNRWLTLGGRLVLVKAVLESQPVYRDKPPRGRYNPPISRES